MASLAELMVQVGADISEFSRGMKQVEDKLKNTGKNFSNIGKSVGNVGSQLAMSVTAPVLALAGSAVIVGASFDKQMSKVQAVSGATGDEFKKLREQALDLGQSTSFSASEVAMAMEELASAGFTTEQILGATGGVLDLAASSGIGLAEASAIAGAAINGFGLEAEDASRVADILAKSAAISAADATSLGEAFKYIAPVANTLGISLEETAAAVGILADAGIDGSQAGTTLRAGLLKLASPTKEMKDLMAETGAEFFDSGGKMKSISGIVDTLADATAGMTDEQKTHYLATMFGQEAVAGFMVLLEEGSDALDKNTDSLKNSGGEAERMAKTMQDNLAGAWEELTGALETLAIKISDLFKGDLQNLTSALTGLVEKFSNLSPGVQKAIVVFGLLMAGIAPLLIVIGFIAQGVGALLTVFGAISAPVLAVIAVVALLVAGLAIAYAKFEPFREKVNAVFNGIKNVVTQALTIVVQFVQEKLAQIRQFWDENGQMILQAVQNVWNFIAPIIQVALNLALAVVKFVWGAIQNVINGALNVIMGLVKIFAGLFTGNFSKMWEGVKQLFAGAIELIWGLMNLSFVGSIRKLVVSFVKNMGKFFANMWDDIVLKFLYGKDKAVALVKGMGSGITKLWNSLKTSVVNLAKSIWNGVKSAFNSMKSGLSGIMNGIRSTASSIWNGIKNTVVNLAKGLWNGVKNSINSMKSGLSSAWNSIKSTASSVWNNVKSAITKPIQSAKDTLLGIIDTIKGAFSRMKITIPKPKLPKISVAMKKGVMGIPYPDFNVSWNAKGGIFNGASILGGGQGVGEAGAEAVLPIQHKRYMAPFARAVAEQLPQNQVAQTGGGVYEFTIPLQIDGKEVARATARFTEPELEKLKKRKSRMEGDI